MIALLLLCAAPELATTTTTATSAPTLEPPRAVSSTTIAYPAGAPELAAQVEVVVKLAVSADGLVEGVELLSGAGEPFDGAVLEGARRFRFAPARYGGAPVPVEIRFTARFDPPARAPIARERPSGVLAGHLRERGTRSPVGYATLTLTSSAGERFEANSDGNGGFELAVPAGHYAVEVSFTGFNRFVQQEDVRAGERLEVGYLVERSNNPYEVFVVGERVRSEVSRTTLSGKELNQVAGTFGDPFRVVNTLPGVSQMMSLLPFPVVRGSSPGNTGFLLDGVRVPLLFHLLAGPSVVHPSLIDRIDFMPGGFPVDYGGYTGGIVDGRTRPAEPDEIEYDLDVNFFQTGLLVRHPILETGLRATAAARLGYPGLLISLASPRISLTYWDYQLRVDGGDRRLGYSLFALGAYDGLSQIPEGEDDTQPLQPFLDLEFHRIDLRLTHKDGALEGRHQLTFGYDYSLSQDDAKLDALSVTLRSRLTFTLLEELALTAGLDGLAKTADYVASVEGAGSIGELLGSGGAPGDTLYSGGLIGELVWRPTPRWVIRPGVRVDLYHDTKSGHAGLDPRLLARMALPELDESLWLKGSVGLFHQPPRFTIPIPGLDQVAFDKGLLEAFQVSAGAELGLAGGFSVDMQGYYNWMDPIFFDVQINPSVEDVLNEGPGALPGQVPEQLPTGNGIDSRLDQLLKAATGRAYGLELLVRRKVEDSISGWLSYTLSRTERVREETALDGTKREEWAAFDFDRTHILNLVLQIPLPRRWQIGFRGQLQTGRPLTTTHGLSAARAAAFVRFDVRVDKTAVWNDWLLDFYVDVSNAVLASEELQPGTELRYVLPTLGFRAMF